MFVLVDRKVAAGFLGPAQEYFVNLVTLTLLSALFPIASTAVDLHFSKTETAQTESVADS